MSHVTKGFRRVLEFSKVYQNFISILGGNELYRFFIDNKVQPASDDRIMDVGCGTGVLLEYLPKNTDYIGLDLNKKYIDKAKIKYQGKGKFFCKKIDSDIKLNYKESFDKVICLAVLHHLDDKVIEELLTSVKSVLKPDGKFVTLDPTYVKNQHPVAKFMIDRDRGQNVKSPNGYEDILKSSFSQVSVSVHDDLIRIPYNHCITVSEV